MILDNLDYSNFIKYSTNKEGGKIKELKIDEINLPEIVEQIYEIMDPKNNLNNPKILFQFKLLGQDQKLALANQMLITRYCIHRVLTHFKVYSSENWSYSIGEDYYGQEIQGLSLKPNIANQINQTLEELKIKNINERIELILQLEYGRLIPSVINKNWQITQVNPKMLYYSNSEHLEQCRQDLNKPEFADYKKILLEYPYPRGLTILNKDGQHKVIDGYHRLVATHENNHPLVIYCLRN